MLTIFGKKKKAEGEGDPNETAASQSTAPSQTPFSSNPLQSASAAVSPSVSSNSSAPVTGTSYQQLRSWSPPLQSDEDSSLSRLLQSLLKDLPADSEGIGNEPSSGFSIDNVPEWVPPRATPASRPMVITPGGKTVASDRPVTPAQPSLTPASVVPQPQPPSVSTRSPKPQEPTIEAPKPAVAPKFNPTAPPDKPAKEELPKKTSTPRVSQSFDHIFELTQGSFESPGLVVVNGGLGSGKTTLCSGLTASFLKQGNPCMFVTYDKAPSALRDQMKKIGSDPSEAESNYRLLVVDGFSSQSDSFSFEPYYIEKAFEFDSIQESLVKNSSMFIGEKTKIVFDSIDQVVAKIQSKDLIKGFGETLDKLRDANATLVVTVDLSKAPKDIVKWLEDTAACVIDLDKDDSDPKGRELKVRKISGSASKIDAETFELDSGKGLVFVK